MRLLVPRQDPRPWPTLGRQVCDWIEDHLVHGPGDVLGEPITLTDEMQRFIYRAYEVYPHDHALAGRRRFKRCVYSRRKGAAKTELASWLAIAEMDPGAPVRCDGFRRAGRGWTPVGRPIRDPYIPMIAVTEEQTEDLAYAAVYAILTSDNCKLVNDYDVGLERIQHTLYPGTIQALASAPSARDGARTTWQHFDETHLFHEKRLVAAHATMLRNIPKRRDSDAWSLETSTMYSPGEESVAEGSHRYAIDIAEGKVADPTLLFDHLEASETWDITDDEQLRAALEEASGDAIAWADIEAQIGQFRDPQTDENENRRYWLNQARRSSKKWIPHGAWPVLADGRTVGEGSEVVLAFKGTVSRNGTALVGATVGERPHVFVLGVWDEHRPAVETVEAAIRRAIERLRVVEFAPDLPGWHREVEDWQQSFGDVVVAFETRLPSRMGPACDDFFQAVTDGEVTHDGNPALARGIGDASSIVRSGYEVIEQPAAPVAVAAVVAHHRARWFHANQPPSHFWRV